MAHSTASNPSSSAPSSPKLKARESPKKPLSISNVANIFIRLRRHQELSKGHHIDCCSGDVQTWPVLTGEGVTEEKKIPIFQEDLFICSGAVDVVKLLRSSRASLYKKALAAGERHQLRERHIVLVDERWECTIAVPKHKSDGSYKVHVQYSASATLSKQTDPQKPIALDQVKGVPGLMTVLERL